MDFSDILSILLGGGAGKRIKDEYEKYQQNKYQQSESEDDDEKNTSLENK